MPRSTPTWMAHLALALALVAGAVLSVREIDSTDIGYHLAYGETLLETGSPVGTNPFLYGPHVGIEDPNARPDPGPGAWYDEDGTYRFANANWLSQALLAFTYRASGDVGLSLLATLCVLGLLLVHARGLRRLGVAPAAVATVVLGLGLLLHWRSNPRPELFGYLVLSTQLYLLLETFGNGRTPTRRQAIALVALQVVMVNLHSYFLLGGLAAAAIVTEACLRSDVESETRLSLARRGGGLVALFAAAAFVNPWTWRVALLPLETLRFLREHRVTDPTFAPRHPWSAIAEFHPLPMPWDAAEFEPSLVLFYLLLAVSAVALVAALARGRVGLAAVLGLALLVATSMRRNVPVAAVLALPAATLALVPFVARLRERATPILGSMGAVTIAVVAIALSVTSTTAAGSQHLGLRSHAGLGLSPVATPIEVATWFDEHQPQGRVWTDFDGSSNLHFFAAAHPEVNVLTNTWAYPPSTMGFVLDRLANAWEPETAGMDIEVVVLTPEATATPLVKSLATNTRWALMLVEPRYVVFVRRDGVNATLAREAALEPETFDTEAWLDRAVFQGARRLDALRSSVRTLRVLGWPKQAIAASGLRGELEPNSVVAWSEFGALNAQYGLQLARRGDAGSARNHLTMAAAACEKALALAPGHTSAAENLRLVERVLSRL